jgi:hypothetical protein
MGRSNQIIISVLNTPRGTNLWQPGAAREASHAAISKIGAAKKELLEFLSGD